MSSTITRSALAASGRSWPASFARSTRAATALVMPARRRVISGPPRGSCSSWRNPWFDASIASTASSSLVSAPQGSGSLTALSLTAASSSTSRAKTASMRSSLPGNRR
jgi:hypothetical protein